MAARGEPSSFHRIFGSGVASQGEDTPSVHELFTALMRDQIDVAQFEELLHGYHRISITPAAARLLSSVDAQSGRLSFGQFQKALSEDSGLDAMQAGRAIVFQDQAKSIIQDNLGKPCKPPSSESRKLSTDISADIFIKQQRLIEKGQAKSTFNPVKKTNEASRGNPFAQRLAEQAPEDPYGSAITHTATRMYVSGEIDRKAYEKFLRKYGVELTQESELMKLISAHEKAGDGKFTEFTRAVQREIANVEKIRSRPASAAGG